MGCSFRRQKKGVTFVNAFQNILDNSMRKPNKIQEDKGSEFYNSSFKKRLKYNETEMYSPNNEGKSVVAKRLIRNLKNKTYKDMTAVSKNVYIDKLDDIVNKYNNAYHKTIKMKPIDVKDNTYIESIKEVKKILHFKLLIMLEYQNTKTFLLMNILQICQKKFL